MKVNPFKVRRFAEACGKHAKTDTVDAKNLAHMGKALELEPDQPISYNQLVLKDLQVTYLGLVKERTRLRNRSQMQSSPVLKRQIKTRLALAERQIAELDREIAKQISDDASAARKHDILCSIPGIAPISAALIITFLPELGEFDRKQAGSLAGLAPYNRESGAWKGKSTIGGGRKILRDALYMPALSAMRFNPDLKPKYNQPRAAGKPAKVAINAIMRKLVGFHPKLSHF